MSDGSETSPGWVTPPDVGVDTTSGLTNGSARDTQAKLYRQQFDDYVKRFGPKEEELIGSYNNKAGLTNTKVAEAKQFAGLGMDNAMQAQQITQSRYQTAMTPQEREAQQRSFSLERGLADVDVANRTRQHIADRYRNMLSGGLSSFSKREVQ